jgi:hypothetical protein
MSCSRWPTAVGALGSGPFAFQQDLRARCCQAGSLTGAEMAVGVAVAVGAFAAGWCELECWVSTTVPATRPAAAYGAQRRPRCGVGCGKQLGTDPRRHLGRQFAFGDGQFLIGVHGVSKDIGAAACCAMNEGSRDLARDTRERTLLSLIPSTSAASA